MDLAENDHGKACLCRIRGAWSELCQQSVSSVRYLWCPTCDEVRVYPEQEELTGMGRGLHKGGLEYASAKPINSSIVVCCSGVGLFPYP